MSEKQLINIYYSFDVEAAKKVEEDIRAKGNSAFLTDACMFQGFEDCDGVVIMPDVPEWRRDSIEAAYGELIITQDTEEVSAPVLPRPRGRPRKVVNAG